jgi:hypothetical protein
VTCHTSISVVADLLRLLMQREWSNRRPLRAAIPHGPWKTTTFEAGLRVTGITAPLILDGPINAQAFQAYVEQFLVPAQNPATSSSWTICRAIMGRKFARRSRPLAPACVICRPIAPTSTRSKKRSPNSEPCSARLPSELSKANGRHSVAASNSSRQPNAKITSRRRIRCILIGNRSR